MNVERWRPIRGFEYQVSDQGRVRNAKGHIVKPFPRGYENQYLGVDLWRHRKRCPRLVHRLVADAFLPPDPGRPEVNHVDCNPRNNRADNLERCTRSENMAHYFFWNHSAEEATA